MATSDTLAQLQATLRGEMESRLLEKPKLINSVNVRGLVLDTIYGLAQSFSCNPSSF